jgi:hypothetical protein
MFRTSAPPTAVTTSPTARSRQELQEIAANYKRVAGFQVEGLNA